MVRARRPRSAALLSCWWLLAGCRGGEPLPLTVVFVDPVDVSTGPELVGRVSVVGDAAVDVNLVEWPDGAPVPATVTDVSTEAGTTMLEVQPASAVADGWYGIRVRAAGDARFAYGRTVLVVDAGREVVSRFGLGQPPMLAALEADSGARVRVRFSERVVVPEGSVVLHQEGRACARLPAHEGPTDGIAFECDLEWPAGVALELGDGITALDGRPVAPVELAGRLEPDGALVSPGGPPSR